MTSSDRDTSKKKFPLIDPSTVKREAFHNQRCYEAALYGIEVVNKLITAHNKGHVILDDEGIHIPNWEFSVEKQSLSHRLTENMRVGYIGGTRDCKSGLIYVTKAELRYEFLNFKIFSNKYTKVV